MKLPKLTPEHLLMYELPSDAGQPRAEDRAAKLLREVITRQRDWKDRRRGKTDKYIDCWANYFHTSNSLEFLRMRQMALSETKSNWRHKVTSGKGFDIVETVVPYMMSATFPNRDWFEMLPRLPLPMEEKDLREFLTIMKAVVKMKFDECEFQDYYEVFLRQLLVLGTSVLCLPWRTEVKPVKKAGKLVDKVVYNTAQVEVADMLNTWLDPDVPDPNKASLIRRFELKRAEVAKLIEDGDYDLLSKADVKDVKAYKSAGYDDNNRQDVLDFMGMQATYPWSYDDTVEVYEYWGDIHLDDVCFYDVIVTWTGKHLLRVEPNPFTCGRPFVVGTCVPVLDSPYGVGLLETVLSLLHEKDSIKNQRLDGLEISVNPSWGCKDDGVFDAAAFKAEPGAVYQMADKETVWPLQADLNFSPVSINEEASIEGEIDRRTATGAFVGSGQGRSGERVTAEEVLAVRDAGGNRLSGIHAHVERQVIKRVLKLFYEEMQQFIMTEEVVPFRKSSGELSYAVVGIDQLAIDMQLEPIGSTHVVDKEYGIRQRVDWITLVSGNPMMAPMVNWEAVLRDLTARMLSDDDTERFVSGAPQAPPTPGGEAVQAAQATGGQDLGQAVQAQLMADGGQNLANAIAPTQAQQPAF